MERHGNPYAELPAIKQLVPAVRAQDDSRIAHSNTVGDSNEEKGKSSVPASKERLCILLLLHRFIVVEPESQH